jgi:predicted SprT family Zn-dependent metalloprotease
MHVPAEIQSRVTAKLRDGLDHAAKAYGQQFSMPVVSYDLAGTVAGYANYNKWTIRLNATLLMENVDAFIERTVPHELAHLITDRVYPEAHASRLAITRTGSVKRTKRDVHGPRWQSVCRVLGMADVKRCHSYDVTNAKVVKSNSRQIEWKCPCGASLLLSPMMSAQLDRTPNARWHRGCRGRTLQRVVPLTRTVDLREYAGVAIANGSSVVVQVPVSTPAVVSSKIDSCRQLYLKYSSTKQRAEMIAMFVKQVQCTPAGAATYYATLKKQYG